MTIQEPVGKSPRGKDSHLQSLKNDDDNDDDDDDDDDDVIATRHSKGCGCLSTYCLIYIIVFITNAK